MPCTFPYKTLSHSWTGIQIHLTFPIRELSWRSGLCDHMLQLHSSLTELPALPHRPTKYLTVLAFPYCSYLSLFLAPTSCTGLCVLFKKQFPRGFLLSLSSPPLKSSCPHCSSFFLHDQSANLRGHFLT